MNRVSACVCRPAVPFCQLLLQSIPSASLNIRLLCVCAEVVDWFLQETYQSAAEPLAADGVDVGLPVRFLGHAALHSLCWCFCAHWAALHGQGALEELRPACGPGVKVCAGGSASPSFSSFGRRWDEVAGVCTVIIG